MKGKGRREWRWGGKWEDEVGICRPQSCLLVDFPIDRAMEAPGLTFTLNIIYHNPLSYYLQ